MPPVKRSDEEKAAITAQVLTGNSGRYIEKETGVPRTSVRRAAETVTARVDVDKRHQIGDMLLELVAESVEGGICAARLLKDDAYLRGHTPSQVAILAGTLMDKAFLILAAAERYNLGPNEGSGGPEALAPAHESAIDVQPEAPADPHRGS